MRALVMVLGTVLIFTGCATSRYAEVWHRKPQLLGPSGPEPLATAEQNFTRAIHEERAKPLVAMGDCLVALQSASDELKRDPRNATAVRDYNFGVSRIFQIIHDAHLDPWTRPLIVPGAHGDFVLTHKPDPRPEWNAALYDFTPADATRSPAVAGYAKGVPMGADLPAAPAGKAPTFLVAALKDRFSGNLDRIQIIKGWLGKDGKPQEKIYDVVWGNRDRRRIVNGKLTPVGNTVDVATATFTNTIGDPELVTVWKDPDFDSSLRAVYYARVIEIPTPRWTAYDAAYFKIKITDPKVPMTTQERAFTSPIWYSPK